MDGPEAHLADWPLEKRVRYEQDLLCGMFAGRVSLLLEDLDLSQGELAARLDASEAWVSELLSERHNPTLQTLARLGVVLGVRWDPQLVPARRRDTPAEDDKPLPSWVGTHRVTGETEPGQSLVSPGFSLEEELGEKDSEPGGETFKVPLHA